MSSNANKALRAYLQSIPDVLVDALQVEFQKLHEEYFLGHWGPSQLDGGRFAEAVLRILQNKDIGTFTAIGTQLNRSQIAFSVKKNTRLPESLRFHVLGLAELIFDFRNKRNVGHLGTIEVNEMDSNIVLQAANWIFAELIRIETQMSPEDTQAEIKKIIERKVPIMEEIGGRLKCLNPNLKVDQKVLVFCYQKYPNPISLDDLFDWTAYSNKSTLKKKLLEIDKETGHIDFRDDVATLTKSGLLWVEKCIPFELEI